jgi:glucose/arabinose dehydrogenase
MPKLPDVISIALKTFAVAALLALPCLATAQPALDPLPGASGLSSPVDVVNAGDGSGRLFIVQQGGEILVYQGEQVLGTPFLDIDPLVVSGGEQGLLGMAFHPNYPATPFFFVNYTCQHTGSQPECTSTGDTIIARFQVSGNANLADPASRRTLLVIPQPFANHNAGDLKFGPDGNLWIPMGDGGSGFDPNCNAQRDDSLLGKLLRIDVNQNVNTPPYYGIPPTNPYIGPGDPRDEVFARGLRNPFRFSFDRLTGDLFIGDVGQNQLEEVDFMPAGTGAAANYGWKIMEGTQCTGDSDACPAYVPPCDSPVFTPPILEYDHSQGDCAIIGGFRYRGSGIPSLAGRYVYSDNCSGTIRVGTEGPPGTWTASVLLESGHPISAFGEDESGELYATALDGTVYRFMPTEPPAVSINDVSVAEGDSGTTAATFTVSLSYSPGLTASADYATGGGTASPGLDYQSASGTLSFGPSSVTRTLTVPVIGDLLDEDDETFQVTLSNPVNAALGDGQGQATILDNDPLPTLSADTCVTIEGDGGTSPCGMAVTLSPVSGRAVTVAYATASGSATSGVDFTAASGSLTFAAGETSHLVSVDVLGDALSEPDESFSLGFSSPVNAVIGSAGAGVILDDDFPGGPPPELVHGTALVADAAGGTPDLYRLAQRRFASYEVALDGVSGDLFPGLQLERLAGDGSTVLQSAEPAGAGTSLSLRFTNDTGATVFDQRLRVGSAACGGSCGPEDVYRLRAYETTARIPRFNNSATQVTNVVLENTTPSTVTGTLHFWSAAGAHLLGQPFSIAPHGTLVLGTAALPQLQGQGGSVTVAHDAPYGALTGKAASVEPATGFSFDTPLQYRPR